MCQEDKSARNRNSFALLLEYEVQMLVSLSTCYLTTVVLSLSFALSLGKVSALAALRVSVPTKMKYDEN
jgi:hypothetical protein